MLVFPVKTVLPAMPKVTSTRTWNGLHWIEEAANTDGHIELTIEVRLENSGVPLVFYISVGTQTCPRRFLLILCGYPRTG